MAVFIAHADIGGRGDLADADDGLGDPAGGVFGLLGIMRSRVSLEYSLWMIDIGMLLVAAALVLTLWKIYHSLQELDRIEQVERVHAHA